MSNLPRPLFVEKDEEELEGPYWELMSIIAAKENLYPSQVYDLVLKRMSPTRTFSNAIKTFSLAYYISLAGGAMTRVEQRNLRHDIENWLDGYTSQIPQCLVPSRN